MRNIGPRFPNYSYNCIIRMQQTDCRQACINVSFKAGHGGSDDVTTCFEAAKVSDKQVKRVLQAMNPVVYVCMQ